MFSMYYITFLLFIVKSWAAPSAPLDMSYSSHGASAGSVIPGRYVVTFKESVTTEQSKFLFE